VTWATPPGTGNAGLSSWRILWRTRVAPSRRNARKGVGRSRLKVRAIPLGNQAPATRPDRSKCGGADVDGLPVIGCDALRCSGPHARYTDGANEFTTLTERSGQSC
jgi:hypothetical protein